MSSIVVAPLAGAQEQEQEQGQEQEQDSREGQVPQGHVDGPPRRARGWRAVRPRTTGAVARAGRRVSAGAHDAGMATAEYAIATLAAVGFAGLLVVLLKSDLVRGLLTGIIKKALQA